MRTIEKSVDIALPVETVYNQWTQFEEFPRFMSGVESVKQIDDTHLRWLASIWGPRSEWDAVITEQVPDERICWRSTSGTMPNSGEVRFERLPDDGTRIHLIMRYEPGDMADEANNDVDLRLQNTALNFKNFIEKREQETGAWRGEIHGGIQTR